jgi:NADH:ubiquinone oxidoreductase subunit 4 (subunit M)
VNTAWLLLETSILGVCLDLLLFLNLLGDKVIPMFSFPSGRRPREYSTIKSYITLLSSLMLWPVYCLFSQPDMMSFRRPGGAPVSCGGAGILPALAGFAVKCQSSRRTWLRCSHRRPDSGLGTIRQPYQDSGYGMIRVCLGIFLTPPGNSPISAGPVNIVYDAR